MVEHVQNDCGVYRARSENSARYNNSGVVQKKLFEYIKKHLFRSRIETEKSYYDLHFGFKYLCQFFL